MLASSERIEQELELLEEKIKLLAKALTDLKNENFALRRENETLNKEKIILLQKHLRSKQLLQQLSIDLKEHLCQIE